MPESVSTAPEHAVIIGGGFFGVSLALHLAARRGTHVTLLEAGEALLTRASLINQARVHQGYHYPRSYLTAYRSRKSFPRFVQDHPAAMRRDFRKLYAIAREHSKVSAKTFVRFCQDIGAPILPADPDLTGLFDRRRIEAVFLTEEYAFDASKLREQGLQDLARLDVQVHCGARVTAVTSDGRRLKVDVQTGRQEPRSLHASLVINCTYSALNDLQRPGDRVGLKHELAEIALVQMPPALKGLGVTVMDGPFFSAIPYPTRELHSLTHVRYTPHRCWEHGQDPPGDALRTAGPSMAEWMRRDAARYLPLIEDAVITDSLYEIKTVLSSAEQNDARPILWRSDPQRPGYHAVLGAKLDNVYDLLETLDQVAPQPVGAS